jgi:Domain of unknown function (DUF4307)
VAGLPPHATTGTAAGILDVDIYRIVPWLTDNYAQEVQLNPTRPAERYGSRRTPRWLPAVLLVTVVAVTTAAAVLGFRNLGSPPIEGRQTAFNVLDEGRVEVVFQVVRERPERAAVCIVRARSRDGDETGRKEVYVPAGARSVIASTVIRTSRRPVTGEVFGCSYDVPAYLEPVTAPSQLISPK